MGVQIRVCKDIPPTLFPARSTMIATEVWSASFAMQSKTAEGESEVAITVSGMFVGVRRHSCRGRERVKIRDSAKAMLGNGGGGEVKYM